jgi:hypothetical protein
MKGWAEMANFFFRHPVYCIKSPRKAWATRKAMEAYRRKRPACEYSGRTGPCHIHHIEPIAYAPGRAADESNFITLHAKLHCEVGHAGNFKNYVANVREICRDARIIKRAKG